MRRVVGNVVCVAESELAISVTSPAIEMLKVSNNTSVVGSHVVLHNLATVRHRHPSRDPNGFGIAVAECEGVAPTPEVLIGVEGATVCVTTLHIGNTHVIWKLNLYRYSRCRREVTTDVMIAPAVGATRNCLSTNCVVLASVNRGKDF